MSCHLPSKNYFDLSCLQAGWAKGSFGGSWKSPPTACPSQEAGRWHRWFLPGSGVIQPGRGASAFHTSCGSGWKAEDKDQLDPESAPPTSIPGNPGLLGTNNPVCLSAWEVATLHGLWTWREKSWLHVNLPREFREQHRSRKCQQNEETP